MHISAPVNRAAGAMSSKTMISIPCLSPRPLRRRWLTPETATAVMLTLSAALPAGHGYGQEPYSIGSRLELFVDGFLIDALDGAQRRLRHPVSREAVWQDTNQVNGQVWGGANRSVTVFRDGDIYRMYYRDWARSSDAVIVPGAVGDDDIVCCYAESTDGIHWTRPVLHLFQTGDLKTNNIVWAGTGGANFAVFKDANPDCSPDARYKAVGRIMLQSDPSPPQPDATGYNWLPGIGLLAYQSPDGIHWSLMQQERIIKKGEFDSYNVAFWDAHRGQYVAFIRVWMPDGTRIRSVATLTSQDFLNWSDPPQWLEYGGLPAEHLYDNNITVYPRAPHLFLGLPMRLVGGRVKVPGNPLPDEHAIDDTVLMSSRDGLHFDRWREAFIRPGPLPGFWWNENICPAWGIVATASHLEGAPDELSFYVNEYYASERSNLRRYTMRRDGFVSLYAGADGGEILTRPLLFTGRELAVNYQTSAIGSLRVELQTTAGAPIPGFRLGDCPPIFGNEVEEVVRWQSGSNVSLLAGTPVRLRFELTDADLYAIQFRGESAVPGGVLTDDFEDVGGADTPATVTLSAAAGGAWLAGYHTFSGNGLVVDNADGLGPDASSGTRKLAIRRSVTPHASNDAMVEFDARPLPGQPVTIEFMYYHPATSGSFAQFGFMSSLNAVYDPALASIFDVITDPGVAPGAPAHAVTIARWNIASDTGERIWTGLTAQPNEWEQWTITYVLGESEIELVLDGPTQGRREITITDGVARHREDNGGALLNGSLKDIIGYHFSGGDDPTEYYIDDFTVTVGILAVPAQRAPAAETAALSIETLFGQTYGLETATDLASEHWTDTGIQVTGNGGIRHLFTPTDAPGPRFHRIT